MQSVAELRGKRVGFVRATTTHYYLFRMLEQAGLSWSDIQPVNLTPADGQAAFRAGSLDAWAIYGYSVPLAKQAGARVLRTAADILSGNYPYFASPAPLADPTRPRPAAPPSPGTWAGWPRPFAGWTRTMPSMPRRKRR